MESYSTSLRRRVKWYRKLAIELVVGSALVNAYIIHQSICNDQMSIIKLREQVIEGLIKYPVFNKTGPPQSEERHVLEDSEKKQICPGCYCDNVTQYGRKVAKNKTAKTKYRCSQCSKYLCIDCFFMLHNTYKK